MPRRPRDGPVRPAIRTVSARPDPPDGVATMGDAFAAAPGEAFRGFGGRHDALDQRGHDFYDWVEQENVSAGQLSTPATGPESSVRNARRADSAAGITPPPHCMTCSG